MSTRMHVFVSAALLLITAFPAFAAAPDPKLAKEIVYRTNLGRADDVKLLIERGVSVDEKSEEGVPILSLAASRNDDEGINVLRALLAAGANVNATDDEGQTALFYAAKSGNSKAVQELLSKGVNSYAVDAKGDVARTIAFRAGHNDIVTQLDKYITDQSLKINKQYEEANAALAKRYKEDQARAQEQVNAQATAQSEAQKAKDEAAAKALEEQRIKAANEKKKLEAEVARLKAEKEFAERQRIIEEERIKAEKEAQEKFQRDTKSLNKLSESLAMNSCSFQYWYYCREAGQPTELSREEIDSAIESNKDKIIELTEKIDALNPDPEDYADQLSNRIKNRIYNQLEAIPSRRQRKEQGVGTMSDMRQRCGEISRQWQITTNSETPIKPAKIMPSSNSGGLGIVSRKVEHSAPKEEPEGTDLRRPPPKIYYKPGQ